MTTNYHSKKTIFMILCLFFLSFSNAQNNEEIEIPEKEKSEFWKKVHFGGGLGLSFSDRFTNITIAPSGLYQFNDMFGIGTGLNANYSKRKNDFEATVLGASIIGILRPVNELQLSFEFEENNVNLKDEITNISTNYWQPALFLGAGYSVGDFGAVGVRYDMLYDDKKSPYGTAFLPFVRVYF